MANLKQYTLKDAWKDWDITLEVNHDQLTVERATLINEYWSDSKWRLSEANQDVVMAVIKMAARQLVFAFLEIGGGTCNTTEAAGYWTRDNLHNQEGWGGTEGNEPFGWCGIRLVSADIEVDLDLEFQED
ncbi:DUF2528 family protein [Pseudomonas chlororaphis]|uniref:DUF2528 family protein n=1 Tax=Pseudomonas chlororaphis TaxID=587753 RepID=UPI00352A4182